MSDWLLDTLLWTGALIALVLLIRRPVAQWFGAQAAYALWLIPALRLFMPGITLPAWMNPAPEPALAEAPSSETFFVLTAESSEPAVPAVAEPVAALPFDILPLLLAGWLCGAAVFLAFRFRAYFRMRRELLEDARQVGAIEGRAFGPIRLVETPATNGPLAFGVIDRVIALPPRFLAMTERPVRDLALAHEVAHHRGGDLFVNFAVQPLFALHWFNPLGWVGWHAMRRDQEAACDARVVGTADAEMRATYAHTIASFAAGPRVALAAPMACPVLGDKSIIQRLRNLTMTDISPRRRWAGRALLMASALALPLTASISYAETVQDAPEVPRAPEAPLPPEAPQPPVPPAAPEAPSWTQDEDFDEAFGEDGEIIKKHRKVVIERSVSKDDDGKKVVVIKSRDKDGKVKVVEREVNSFTFIGEDGEVMTDKDIEKLEKRLEKKMKAREKEWEAMGEKLEKRMEMRFGKDFEDKMAKKIKLECDESKGQASSVATEDGAFAFAMCAEGFAEESKELVALSLKEARNAIKHDRNLTKEQRKEALKGLDEALAELKSST